MIVVVGLLARIAAVVPAVTSGTGGSAGGTAPLSENFVTFGQHLTESRHRSTALRARQESRQEGRS
jgi:hypothetical protein